MADNTLVAPSLSYDPEHEKKRNRRIEELFRGKANREQQAIYTGTPHAALKGSNATFSVPGNGVITKLPFNTVLQTDPNILTNVLDSFVFAYEMNISLWAYLVQIGGDNSTGDVTLYLYRNGVAYASVTDTIAFRDKHTFNRFFFAQILTPGAVFDLRMSININKTMTLDMAASRWWVTQLTPNPFYVEGGRLGLTTGGASG